MDMSTKMICYDSLYFERVTNGCLKYNYNSFSFFIEEHPARNFPLVLDFTDVQCGGRINLCLSINW